MAAGYLQACLYLGFFGPAGSYPLIRKAEIAFTSDDFSQRLNPLCYPDRPKHKPSNARRLAAVETKAQGMCASCPPERLRWCMVEMEDILANAMKHRAGNARESVSLAGKDPDLQSRKLLPRCHFVSSYSVQSLPFCSQSSR